MRKQPDEVFLSKRSQLVQWPVELAEKLLASPLSWGPPAYALGIGYIDDSKQPDQSEDFFALMDCIDGIGSYERHGGKMEQVWNWATPIIDHVKVSGSCAEYATQDLLDIMFLIHRSERFSDGSIRRAEAVLREMLREVVQRVHSFTPPVFLVQK